MDWINARLSAPGILSPGFFSASDPRLGWLNAVSGAAIAVFYYALSLLLAYLARRWKDAVFHRVFLCLALITFACGTTHALEIVTVWHPVYWLSGILRAATAVASMVTVVILVPLLPQVLARLGPDAMRQVYRHLPGAGEAPHQTDATLEARIAEHLISLTATNAAMRDELEGRKKTDERLRENERQFRLAISSSPIPSIIYDETGTVRLVSQGWTNHSGYVLEDIPTLSDWIRKAYGEGKGGIDAGLAERFTFTETTYDGEWTIRTKDGAERTWDLHTTPLGQDQDGVRSLITRALDITDRRRAEAAQARLAAIVTGSEDAIVSKDLEETITSWNAAAERLFGYTADEMLGQPESRLLLSDRLDEETQHLARFKRGERVEHYETVRRHKDGRLIAVSLSIAPIQDASGGVIGASNIARDITERKRLERLAVQNAEELARSHADLAQFASVASHDLQEPLRAVAGCVQLLERRYGGRLDQGADELIGMIVNGSSRMKGMIDGLLAYAESGQGERLERVEAGMAVKNALENLAAPVAETHAEITFENLPSVRFHPAHLEQVFQQLLANAIKFRSALPPAIHIGAERQAEGWRFRLADNGIGFEPQFAEDIFRVFLRLHPREQYPGIGIGLAIVRRIVGRRGGKVWAESVPSHGSTFYFTVPDRESA